ncbi:MAG: hypothetical protein AAFX93_11810 [Verrucomicrobiota bacterium]
MATTDNTIAQKASSSASSMGKFLFEFSKFGIIQVAILSLILYIFFSYPRDNDPSAWGVEKRERMENTPGPRLVLMGDSNVVLGVSSPMLHEAYPEIHPVNAGLYAFLGHRIILNEIEDLVQPGDTVVISWVYAHFAANEIQNLYYHYAVQRPESFKHFTGEEIRWFFDGGTYLIKEALKRTKKILLLHKRDAFGPPYGRDNLNEYGDGVGHYGMESPPGTRTTIKEFVATPDGYTGEIIEMLNDLNKRMEERGARMLFAYPPISEQSYVENETSIKLLDNVLHERLEFPIINQPEAMLYPDDVFFDSSYHLKEDAVYDRTERLIDSLRPFLRSEGNSDKPIDSSSN